MKGDETENVRVKVRGRATGLENLLASHLLLASDSLAESRERVTARWSVHFRYRTPESEKCTQWELCPFQLSGGVTQTCTGMCKLSPETAFS